MTSPTDLAREERTDLADLLETLSDDQWEAPSLCAGWTVRHVVAHMLSYEELSWPDVARRMARARGNPDTANAIGVREYAARSPDDLVALLRRSPRPATGGHRPRLVLRAGRRRGTQPFGGDRPGQTDWAADVDGAKPLSAYVAAAPDPRRPARGDQPGLRQPGRGVGGRPHPRWSGSG